MSTTETLPIHVAGARLRSRVPEVFAAYATEAMRETAITVHSIVVPRAPVGTYPETSPHPGKLRASARMSPREPVYADLPDRAGYMVPGRPEAEASLRSLKAGDDVFLTYDAKTDGAKSGYAASIEAGLREKNGRTYGSSQAPDGWIVSSWPDIRRKGPAIARRVARRLR